jgi:hypothetical protein
VALLTSVQQATVAEFRAVVVSVSPSSALTIPTNLKQWPGFPGFFSPYDPPNRELSPGPFLHCGLLFEVSE